MSSNINGKNLKKTLIMKLFVFILIRNEIPNVENKIWSLNINQGGQGGTVETLKHVLHLN